MLIIKALLWCGACGAAGAVMFPLLVKTMTKGGHVRLNFKGRYIPTSLGIGFVLLTIAMLLVLGMWNKGLLDRIGAAAIIVCGFGFLGLLDDVIETRGKGGFRGHLARMGAEGEVSTALLKAFFGFGVALLAAVLFWRDQGLGMAVVNALIVALSANALNLLDVRPGRAVKGFAAGTLFILIGSEIGFLFGGRAGILPATWFLIGPFLAWTAVYAPVDFRCRGMLGDTGSNALGAVLGLLIVWELSALNRLLSLGLLIGYHLFTEVVSISALIEKAPPLKWLDSLGIRPD
jgi:UDP-N-acetylmuramyl pentapeptide phosphotransferase/UDP-N-acetylglucosamine-1-phosphate transferase